MAFEAGTRLGPYEIVSPLGAGGMGEVYRARDTRLDRTVAIKVLTGALLDDADARRRFEDEARTIASLNDPHICTIHDVGRHEALDYLVLEYLEGETLAQRLQRTAPLPVGEALGIAIQIADALDRAHRAGIVHRDLKPGNVMLVRRRGAQGAPDVKLLDFGLAARTTSARAQPLDASLAATMGPSMVATRPPSATVAGSVAGTVPYMSPEQLDGQEGDARADVFAFGCVLYEMLAGRKPFEGAAAVTVIAAIMSSDPPAIAGLQSHPVLDHLLRRCLEKDRDRRWQSMADVAGELRWMVDHPIPMAGARPARSRRAALLAVVAAMIAAVAAGGAVLLRGGTATDVPTLRFEISTPPTDEGAMALSRDGTQLAFVANQDRVPMLWVRSLDALENRALPGTDGARLPFWSADGRSIGFFTDDALKRVDVAGGRPIVLADVLNGRGGAWNADGVILFAADVNGPIMRVSAGGGQVEPVTEAGAGWGPDHRWPQFLPDGRRYIFSTTLGTPETNGVYVASLDGGTPVRVLAAQNPGRFAAPDRLLVGGQGTMRVYRFDPASAVVQGDPLLIAHGVGAVSDTGVLAYRTGTRQRRQLVWVDRRGTELRALGEPEADDIASPELSPDERSVAVFSHRSGENDIWVIELARNLARRVTDGPPADAHPLWDPDGQHVVFASGRLAPRGPVRQSVIDGKAATLFANGERGLAIAWSRDRAHVLVRREGDTTGVDLVAVAPDGSSSEVVVAASTHDETEGQFSPDGRWVALVSNESGRPEVFVQSFPDGRGRTQVSTAGGAQVRWSADGREIFYVAPDGMMMAVAVALDGAALELQLPVPLFQTYLASGTNVLGNKPQYAVSRDGRFLLNTAVETTSAPIIVWVNWMKHLVQESPVQR